MDRPGMSKAELEYAIMLAVLDFQTEFMKSSYSHVQARMLDGVIEVVLTRATPIPAEECLSRSPEGERLLRQVYEATFNACQGILRARIEQVLGEHVQGLAAMVDPLTGRSTITITLLSHTPRARLVGA